jgi:hypothetical protein
VTVTRGTDTSARSPAFALALMLGGVCASGCGDDPGTVSLSKDKDPEPGGRTSNPPRRVDAGIWQLPMVVPPDPQAGDEYLLSQTGLYRDIVNHELAPDLVAFEPAFTSWGDGASKQHWLRLPKGKRIDSSDMDHWQFPVGAMLFQELALHGKRLETRVIIRTGSDGGDSDYFMGAFAWNDDDSDARLVRDGASNVRDTAHDVPPASSCSACHGGEPGRVIGFSAVQQPNVSAALLNAPPLHEFVVPGDQATAAALGYLHANCAHCHNPQGAAFAKTDMDLRLLFDDRRATDTAAFRTAVAVPLQSFTDAATSLRVTRGNPAGSAVVVRMMERGSAAQMPPLATELADDDGIAAVSAWIERL